MSKSPLFTCSVPLLHSLHWLPVKFRILFKISLFMSKLTMKNSLFIFTPRLPSCSLRSNKGITVSVSKVNTNTGAIAFHSCAPSLWNNLPLSIQPSDAISDHFSVVADLKIPTDHSHTVLQTITYRKLKAINMEAFKADINNSDLIKNPNSNATELAQQYDSVLSTLIDFHAPLATKKISSKPPNPWMTPAILASKRHRRYLERVWRRYPTALNTSRFSKQIHLCNKQMSKAKPAHYSKIIAEHSGDHRSLWQALNKILHRCPKMYLPDHSSITALANTFSFFHK